MQEMRQDVFVPNMQPGEIPGPNRAIFAQMGREAIYRMIGDFYQQLERSAIRNMFPPDMQESARRSGAFFVQLLGGPPEYNQQHGNPRMRARHLPFRINESARLEWLACFERVLVNAETEYGFPAEHLEGFRRFLDGFSKWMVNTAD
ncbi:MAG TPA: hypothetical protein VKP30_04370 [Polyangiaceae bacterium]|nr:hypothetical protein [Polyangiaceae bacterium]